MAGQEEFVNTVNSLMEGLWSTIAPLLVWSGTVASAITKKIYKVWKNGGTLQYAEIAKAEWPIEQL